MHNTNDRDLPRNEYKSQRDNCLLIRIFFDWHFERTYANRVLRIMSLTEGLFNVIIVDRLWEKNDIDLSKYSKCLLQKKMALGVRYKISRRKSNLNYCCLSLRLP